MESSTLSTDRYLITFGYRTLLHSKEERAGRDVSSGDGKLQRVEVHVTNRLPVPLTSDNLQSLSFSVPGLHTRLNGTVADDLFHYGNVQMFRLPSARDVETVSLAPRLACLYLDKEDAGDVARSDLDVSREHWQFDQPEDTPIDSSGSMCPCSDFNTRPSSPDSFLSTWNPCWDSAMGSPSLKSPNLPYTTPTSEGQSSELFSVDFKGVRYIRSLFRIKCTAGDAEATWVMTDFTERGEQVFSLRLDFIRPRPAVPRWMQGITEE